MNCHAQRINKKLIDEAELRIIKEMSKHSTPLFFALGIALTLIVVSELMEAYAAYRYEGYMQTSSVFAKCLSGAPIDTGDGIATCKVVVYPIVRGMEIKK